MTARMVNKPATLDTIVATNLHADILSDLAAALAGSLGIAPTGNIDPERRYPSMFEPIHGSAFDIMGKGLANPVGTFWSCVMLLEHLGEHAAAKRLMQAIETVTATPALHTRDLGGTAKTVDVTQAVCRQIAAAAPLITYHERTATQESGDTHARSTSPVGGGRYRSRPRRTLCRSASASHFDRLRTGHFDQAQDRPGRASPSR